MSAGPSFGSAPKMMKSKRPAARSANAAPMPQMQRAMPQMQMAMPQMQQQCFSNAISDCSRGSFSLSESDSSSVEDMFQAPQQNIGENILENLTLRQRYIFVLFFLVFAVHLE